MIKAEIVADSVNPLTNDRITSFLLVYPRFIHSELMTHRVFSRNAASSRAIPVERMIKMIEENPAEPVEWGTVQKGMQAGPPLSGHQRALARGEWHFALGKAISSVRRLLELGVHKQIANRILEPWAHMTTLVTATEWGNFFRLRAHPDAQPEFQELAFEMLRAFLDSQPQACGIEGWHLPFDSPDTDINLDVKIKVCVARCARTSYLSFDGEHSVEKDMELHDRLLTAGHMSPFEHVATPMDPQIHGEGNSIDRWWSGNYHGWKQYRQMVEPSKRHARVTREELQDIYSHRPSREM